MRMRKSLGSLVGALSLGLALLLSLSGCSSEAPSSPQMEADAVRNADGTGEGWDRYPCGCVQDLFIEIGQRVPGYGGFWLERGASAVVVGVTDLSLADTAVAETQVFFNEARREELGLSGEVRVVEVDYGFADLAQWSSDLTPIMWWKRVNGLSVRTPGNRIRIRVSDVDEVRPRIEAWAAERGIPIGALDIQVGEYVTY